MKIQEICRLRQCPICDRELFIELSFFASNRLCPNKCFDITYDDNITLYTVGSKKVETRIKFYVFNIFDEDITRFIDDSINPDVWRFDQKVAYWRKDYRYLAEILERA